MANEQRDIDATTGPKVVVHNTHIMLNDRLTQINESQDTTDSDSESDSSISVNSFTESLIESCNNCFSCHCARGHPSTWEGYLEEKRKSKHIIQTYPPKYEQFYITYNYTTFKRTIVKLPLGMHYQSKPPLFDIFDSQTDDELLKRMFS